MGVGASIFLIAVGAVLEFAITASTTGSPVDIGTVGIILMVVGGLGLLMSLLFWGSWGGWTPSRRVVRDDF